MHLWQSLCAIDVLVNCLTLILKAIHLHCNHYNYHQQETNKLTHLKSSKSVHVSHVLLQHKSVGNE